MVLHLIGDLIVLSSHPNCLCHTISNFGKNRKVKDELSSFLHFFTKFENTCSSVWYRLVLCVKHKIKLTPSSSKDHACVSCGKMASGKHVKLCTFQKWNMSWNVIGPDNTVKTNGQTLVNSVWC